MKNKNNKSYVYILLSIVGIFVLIAIYGFFERNKKMQVYEDFRANKKIMCGDVVVQKSKGWSIRNNRFFTNGSLIKTIAFCKSAQ